ncbi:MAG: membrane integrity-associated transporter subunit PqiC [Thiothrix sp.]
MRGWMYLVAISLSACSTPVTLYHTLDSDNGIMQVPQTVAQHIHSLGVGPVRLPSLLDRQGLVIRQDAHTLTVSDTHLWGGQLEDELLNALSHQLQLRLPRTRVQTIPWELNQTPQYQITVHVKQFDGTPGGKAWLRGTWQLQTGRDGKIIATYPMELTRQTTTPGVTGLVNVQSELLADLAAQITQAVSQNSTRK